MAAWDDIPEDEKPFQRRLMEVAAGFAEHVDVQVGRLVDEIERLGYGDNTLIFYIWGDNGSSGEGQNGTISELLAQNGIPTTVEQHIKALDELGGLDVLGSPKIDNQYHAGMGVGRQHPVQGHEAAGVAPRRHPQPDGGAMAGEDRARRHATRAVPPLQRHRADHLRHHRHHRRRESSTASQQDPIDGVSFAYTFDDPDGRRPAARPSTSRSWAAARSTTTAGSPPRSGRARPGCPVRPPGIAEWTPDKDVWELYHLDEDWTQANDLAAQMPEKLAQMKETVRHRGRQEQRLPRRRRPLGRRAIHPETAHLDALPRVDLHRPDIVRMPEFCAPALGNRDNLVTIDADIPENVNGVLYALGGSGGGLTVLRRRRHPDLRVQPVHPDAHQDHRSDQAPRRPRNDRHRDHIRRGQTRRAARHQHHGQRRRRTPPVAYPSALRCSSAPTTASTSGPASAAPSPSTTTTGPPSPSKGPSTRSTSDTSTSVLSA